VLYGDRFVARFEPVRNKKNGILTIKNWWWEPGVNPTDDIVQALKECIECFVAYLYIKQINFCEQITNLDDIGRLATQLAKLPPRKEI
jgi:uncharacterized protein YcaQ